MDLLAILKRELDLVGSKWDLFDKSLYIYIRTCEIFSYDPYFAVTDNVEKWKKAYYKKMSISNIQYFEITCFTWCRIYKKLLKQILDIDVEIKGENGRHRWCSFSIKNEYLELDSTFLDYNDLVRVKNHDFINGIKILDKDGNIDRVHTYEKIRNSLLKIGYYCDYLYSDYLFLLHQDAFLEDVLKEYLGVNIYSDMFDIINKKYNYIKNTLSVHNKRICDVIADVKLLETILFNDKEKKSIFRITMYKEDPFSIKYMSLVDGDDTKVYVTEEENGKISMNVIDKDIPLYIASHKSRNQFMYKEIKKRLKIK